MSIVSGLVSLLLAAATLPFPPPAVGPISDDAKFCSGPIISVDPDGKSFVMNTLTGQQTVLVTATSRILGVDSKPTVLTGLKPGTYVRAYWVQRTGPELEELDQLPSAMR